MTCAALKRVAGPLAALVLLSGCGGNEARARRPAAPRCEAGVRRVVAQSVAGKVGSHLVSGDQESAICAYRAGGERLTVEVDANPQAYRAYVATVAHQVQANTGLGGAVPRSDYPRAVRHVGTIASWLPRERQLVTTDARSNGGGAFVRVTIVHHGRGAPADRSVATRVARAALEDPIRP